MSANKPAGDNDKATAVVADDWEDTLKRVGGSQSDDWNHVLGNLRCGALARLMDLKGSLASRSPSTGPRARRELTSTVEIGGHRRPLGGPQTAAGELGEAPS
jgi:hypothetical protein